MKSYEGKMKGFVPTIQKNTKFTFLMKADAMETLESVVCIFNR